MQDITRGGIPLMIVGSLILGTALYSSSIESRFTRLEANSDHQLVMQKETKEFFKEFMSANKSFQLQQQKIYEKLNDNLALTNQRLVILETLAKEKS